MTTTTLTSHVREYVARVRLHLADLTPDEADDLLGGHTADLMEALLDAPLTSSSRGEAVMDLDAVFGPPEDYAAELRGAAGLTAEPLPVPPEHRPGMRQRWRARIHRAKATRAWFESREFLASIRPTWWVLPALFLGSLASLSSRASSVRCGSGPSDG